MIELTIQNQGYDFEYDIDTHLKPGGVIQTSDFIKVYTTEEYLKTYVSK
ncbi:hypothetical protein [Bacillus sp. C30]